MKLFGYNRASLLKEFTPQDDEALARHSLNLLRQGRFDQVKDSLDPNIRNGETDDALTAMNSVFPPGEPTSVKTVDSRFIRSKDGSTSSITLEYEFVPQALPTSGNTELRPRAWLLAQVVVQTRGNIKTIAGFHILPVVKSFEEMNEFTLVDKGISQYAGLCLAIGASSLTLYAFVLCIRTKMGKRKLVWLVLILIGVFRFTVDWTSGQWSVTPLTIQAPPVIALASMYGPWMIEMTVPLGALAFLILRRRRTSGFVHSLPPTMGQMPDAQTPS